MLMVKLLTYEQFVKSDRYKTWYDWESYLFYELKTQVEGRLPVRVLLV